MNKHDLTHWILKCANKVPVLFPIWLVQHSEFFAKESEEPKGKYRQIDEAYKKASVLEEPFFIKAISIVVKINSEELNGIHLWLKRQGSTSNYNKKRDSHSFDTRFDQSDSFRTLGWITFNSKNIISELTNINIDNQYCSGCYATIKKFPKGLCYLSLYMMMDEKANEHVKKIDVSHIKRTKLLGSFNPFSKQRKTIEFFDRKGHIKNELKANLDKLTLGAVSGGQHILKLFNIKKTLNEMVIVKDFVVDKGTPYLDKTLNFKREITDDFILFHRHQYYIDDQFSDDAGEHYCESDEYIRDLIADAIFIKSESQDNLDSNFNFSKTGRDISDSHLFISTLLLCFKEYNSISKRINEGLLNGHSIPEKYHESLFKGLLELKSLKLNSNALNESLNWSCSEKYQLSAKAILKHLNEKIDELLNTASEQVDFARDSIQAKNLKFHKRYSFIIAFLVIAQIALAINFQKVDLFFEKILNTSKYTEQLKNQKLTPHIADKVRHI